MELIDDNQPIDDDAYHVRNNAETVQRILNSPFDPKRVKKRQGAGNNMFSYITGDDCIRQLNTTFGYLGWNSETKEIKAIGTNRDSGVPIGFSCIVKLHVCAIVDNVMLEAVREGAGWGTVRQGKDGRPTNPENIELAYKECETDALKRAARTLGDQFGLKLYDKEAAEHYGFYSGDLLEFDPFSGREIHSLTEDETLQAMAIANPPNSSSHHPKSVKLQNHLRELRNATPSQDQLQRYSDVCDAMVATGHNRPRNSSAYSNSASIENAIKRVSEVLSLAQSAAEVNVLGGDG